MDYRLLVVCGQTAAGKTRLALELAKRFNGELISADSRQVYKYMDVVTGKDIPEGFLYTETDLRVGTNKIGYYGNGEVRIWGYDLATPDEEFSIKHYSDAVHTLLPDIYGRGKLPILVGGSGFYIDAVLSPPETITVPVNEKLRTLYAHHTTPQLYELLTKADPARALDMNTSDRANPRRLLRALEVADYRQKSSRPPEPELVERVAFNNVLWVGVKLQPEELARRIAKRVEERSGEDLVEELGYLEEKGYLRHAPRKTIGYRQWIDYLDGAIDRQTAVDMWRKAEEDYAGRQLTWFAKHPEINWFDGNDLVFIERVALLVKTWYSSSRNG